MPQLAHGQLCTTPEVAVKKHPLQSSCVSAWLACQGRCRDRCFPCTRQLREILSWRNRSWTRVPFLIKVCSTDSDAWQNHLREKSHPSSAAYTYVSRISAVGLQATCMPYRCYHIFSVEATLTGKVGQERLHAVAALLNFACSRPGRLQPVMGEQAPVYKF